LCDIGPAVSAEAAGFFYDTALVQLATRVT